MDEPEILRNENLQLKSEILRLRNELEAMRETANTQQEQHKSFERSTEKQTDDEARLIAACGILIQWMLENIEELQQQTGVNQ